MTHIHRPTITKSEASEITAVLGLDKLKSMAQDFANAYDADNGDSVREYCDQASRDVYPSGVSRFNGERANFKGLVRHYIRERQHGRMRRAA